MTMAKLILSMFLVTVYQCYGHYPPTRTLPTQSETAFDLQSVIKSISNDFNWNFGGQIQSSQYNAEPDVVVMIIEYTTNEQSRKPPSHHGYTLQHGSQQQNQPSISIDTSYGDNKFWYNKMYQNQYGYNNDRPRLPNRPLVEQIYSDGNKYEDQYFQNRNPVTNPGYDNFEAQHNKRPWAQNEGNYNQQNYDGNTQLNQDHAQIGQRPTSYDTPIFGYPNQFNQNNPQYPNYVNQWDGSDQQNSNNGGINSGTQNPINNNPDDVISQFPTISNSPVEDKVAEQPESPSVLPGTEMESEGKKPDEEEEDFQIDIRFKAD